MGNFGYDFAGGEKLQQATLALVTARWRRVGSSDGSRVSERHRDHAGSARRSILGETFGRRLTAFDIAGDGTLSNRRVWADLGNVTPDGICLDEAGGIWVADPTNSQCVRVLEGGEVTDRIATEQGCFACMLGGRGSAARCT